MKKWTLVVSLGLALPAIGCATYKQTLTNAKGESVTCEASGKTGIVSGYYLRKGFEDCVADARAKGYN